MASSQTTAGTTTFTYNADGQRVAKESVDSSVTGYAPGDSPGAHEPPLETKPMEIAPPKAGVKTVDSSNIATEEAAQAANVTAPIDFDGHILSAEVKNGKVVGGHSTATGQVRVIPGTASAPNPQGVYKAKIEVADPSNPGQFLTKTNNNGYSTMFQIRGVQTV